MKTKTLYHIVSQIEVEELSNAPLVYYEGEVNHAITRSLTLLIENMLEAKGFTRLGVKKVFNIMVECLQNLDKHLDPLPVIEDKPTKRAAVILIEKEDVFSIVSCNLIENDKVADLEKRLSELKNKSKEELRQLYKKQLEMGRISSKGGAGLGFIDMARKSGLPFDYKFSKFLDEYSIFIIKFMVSKIGYEKN